MNETLARRLAIAMAEEGFAVPSSNRDEQWDAPYAEAERIVEKLDLAARGVRVGDEGLRAALERIRDMVPEPVDESLPDHSDCAECKRIQSTPYHPSTCCDDLYREFVRLQARREASRQGQYRRMRDIAYAALAATPTPPEIDVELDGIVHRAHVPCCWCGEHHEEGR